MNSGASQKYDTMSLEEICQLPIQSITDDDSVLFLWATTPLLPEALMVMQAWGFKYKTKIVWRKMSLGIGYWFRIQTEDLLVGVRGNVKAFRCQHPNYLESKRLGHSVKPDEFRELIERCTAATPNPRRLELFARGSKAKGWDMWGLEAPQQLAR